jgi:hypothetical protein
MLNMAKPFAKMNYNSNRRLSLNNSDNDRFATGLVTVTEFCRLTKRKDNA